MKIKKKVLKFPRSIAVTFPILQLAVYLWILDVIGIDAWVAHTIGHFIGMVVDAAAK